MLGGHGNTTHVDQGVLEYLVQRFSPRTMIDIDCGPGAMIDMAREYNIEAYGIDGDPALRDRDHFIRHDFTVSPWGVRKQFDLGWSVEFVEHVEAKYENNYMRLMSQCKVLCMAYSLNPKPVYHVNMQDWPYWEEQLGKYGLVLDLEATDHVREMSTMKRDFMRETGLVFTNVHR